MTWPRKYQNNSGFITLLPENKNTFQNIKSNAKRQSLMSLALIRVQVERFLLHTFRLSDINEENSAFMNK